MLYTERPALVEKIYYPFGNIRRTIFSSSGPTYAGRRSCRIRFGARFEVKWLLFARARFTRPLPVTRNFFAAILFVFIFGITPLLLCSIGLIS
jgi:hypothetical protein